MSPRSEELALRRRHLLERSAIVRERIAIQSVALTPALKMGDRIRDSAHWVRMHPAWVVSAVVVITVVRPRTTWRWTLRAWAAWKFVRRWRIRLAPFAGYI